MSESKGLSKKLSESELRTVGPLWQYSKVLLDVQQALDATRDKIRYFSTRMEDVAQEKETDTAFDALHEMGVTTDEEVRAYLEALRGMVDYTRAASDDAKRFAESLDEFSRVSDRVFDLELQ